MTLFHAPRVGRVLLVCLAALLAAAFAQPATAADRTFVFRGRGWGHAVGMSQWGARGLAEAGWSEDRILTRYYKGTQVQGFATPSDIRVGLLQERSEITVSGDGRFDFFDNSGTPRASGASGQLWRLRPNGEERLDVIDHKGKRRFTSQVPVTLRYRTHWTRVKLPQTGYEYTRGRMDFDVNRSTGKARAILIIRFEQYLYGIAEMPSSWHAAALRAQAIAARTYALEKVRSLGQNRNVCNCAVYASTADQAYAGVRSETAAWRAAVDARRGTVVTYSGKPIKALYSSASGGFTENNEYVWGGSPLPYLRGRCDPRESFGDANPHNNWTITIDGAELDKRVRDAGHVIGEVQRVRVRSPRGVSGRITPITSSGGGVSIEGTVGEVTMSGSAFRSMLGAKSTLFHYHINGPIRAKWERLSCGPSLPTTSERTWRNLNGTNRGTAQDFKKGRLFRNGTSNAVYWVRYPILDRYDELRAGGKDLGLPTSDEYIVGDGDRRSDFERGRIRYDPKSGRIAVRFTA